MIKARVTLVGEASCFTDLEITEEQFEFLEGLSAELLSESSMWAPSMDVEKI
jgi:hypothetical protein